MTNNKYIFDNRMTILGCTRKGCQPIGHMPCIPYGQSRPLGMQGMQTSGLKSLTGFSPGFLCIVTPQINLWTLTSSGFQNLFQQDDFVTWNVSHWRCSLKNGRAVGFSSCLWNTLTALHPQQNPWGCMKVCPNSIHVLCGLWKGVPPSPLVHPVGGTLRVWGTRPQGLLGPCMTGVRDWSNSFVVRFFYKGVFSQRFCS